MSSSDRRDTPTALMLLLFGAVLVVAGVACWSIPGALVCAGLLAMVGAVALATVQEAVRPAPAPEASSNGVAPDRQVPVG